MQNKRIYLITSSFPPGGRGGSVLRGYRALSLLKSGFDVTAIVPQHHGQQKSTQLLDELKAEKGFHHLPCDYPKNLILPAIAERLGFIKDFENKWVGSAKNSIESAHSEAVTYAICGSNTAPMQIGLYLKQRFGIPMIADFRDPVVNTTIMRRDWWAVNRDKFAKSLIMQTDAIVSSTDSISEFYIKDYGYDKEIITVYGGYGKNHDSKPKQIGEIFNIGYGGGASRNLKADVILRAFEFMSRKDIDRIKIHFWTDSYKHFDKKLVEKYKNNIVLQGFAPHGEFIRKFAEVSDISFVPVTHKSLGYAIPSKIFEAINLIKPVIFFGPEGEMNNFFEKYPIGFHVTYPDAKKLAELLTKILNEPAVLQDKLGTLQRIKEEFSVEKQTEKVIGLMERVGFGGK